MSTEHTYQIGDRVRMIGNGHVGKVVGSLGSSPLYPRRVLIESLVDEVRWYCLPAELSPVAPEPTADTAAEPEAGWPVWWNGGWCNENGTGRYAPLDVDSGEPWPIWSDMPGAVPAAVPSPEPPAAACANCDLAPNTHQRMSNEILAEGAARLDAEWEVEFARIIGEKRNTVRFKRIAKDTRALIVDRMAGPSPAASQEPGETR